MTADIGGAIYASTDKDVPISKSLEISSSGFVKNRAYMWII